MMIFFRNPALICLGALIVFISIAVASGGLEIAGMIIGASIVCTLGISLLIWIPLCWCVGWIVFEICSLLFGQERMRRAFRIVTSDASQREANSSSNLELNSESNPQINPELLSLINYIEKTQRRGCSDTQIFNRLKAEGWEDDEIEEAQNFVRNKYSES
jgi:hypothetical protein